ncbi:MAG: redoxin domain-containing protein [Myxococcales bacterium]|nr:redoxin domain-containing protein [Myxococcales bacterium]
MERLLERFRAANTAVMGISVDSVYSHANWAQSLGGVSFPLLADFHPKGAMASAYGLYLEDKGITDRATVIVDAAGKVAYANSVTPAGERDIAALAAECERIDKAYADAHGALAPLASQAKPLGADSKLYVKSNCGFSRAVLLARDNLHLELATVNVSEDAAALDALEKASGKRQAPCLVEGGTALLESKDIIARFLQSFG